MGAAPEFDSLRHAVPARHAPAAGAPAPDVVRPLVLALAEAAAADRAGRAPPDGLREAVGAYVTALRDAGLPPEAVLVALKRDAARAGIHGVERGDARLVESLVRWCVTAYFPPV